VPAGAACRFTEEKEIRKAPAANNVPREKLTRETIASRVCEPPARREKDRS
jgi:hypothetical protein